MVDTVGNTQISPSVTLSKDTVVAVSILNPSSFQFTISQARAPSLTVSGFGDPGTIVFVVVSDSNPLTSDVISKEVTVTPVGSWSVVVNVMPLSEGNLLFVATGTDSANNVFQSQTITLKKDTTLDPATIILTPVDQSTVSDTLVISGTAEPNSRVSLTISGTGTITRNVVVPVSGSWTTTVGISNIRINKRSSK